MRPAIESGEKPPKITECTAPMRAQARMRDRRLRDHRHVDGDAVAFLDAARLQDVGEAADLGVQLLVGELLVVLRIVAFPEDGGLVAAFGQMAVDAVVGRR